MNRRGKTKFSRRYAY